MTLVENIKICNSNQESFQSFVKVRTKTSNVCVQKKGRVRFYACWGKDKKFKGGLILKGQLIKQKVQKVVQQSCHGKWASAQQESTV